jgi:predicted SAM-dependent methyltransferase
VYSVADRIDNCNFSGTTIWEGTVKEGDTYVFNGKKAPGRQFISEASDLQCVKDSSYRFVLSSHCIEHLANPLQGLKEWIRILEPSGLLVLVVPHKDGTFDHRRPLTSIEHLVHDLNSQTDEHDLTHLEEILKFHDLERDRAAGDFQSFQSRSLRNFETRCLHHHTFDTRLAIEMIHYVGLQILNVELFKPCNIVIIAKKIGAEQTVDNERFRGINSAPCWVSPFPSDQVAGGTLNPRKSR